MVVIPVVVILLDPMVALVDVQVKTLPSQQISLQLIQFQHIGIAYMLNCKWMHIYIC